MMAKIRLFFYSFTNSSVILHWTGDACISVSSSGWPGHSFTF